MEPVGLVVTPYSKNGAQKACVMYSGITFASASAHC